MSPPVHPERDMRWYFLVTGAMALGYGSIYTLLADLRDRFGFTETQLGLIAASGFFAGFVAQVVLARQADRGHAPAMVRTGVAIAALAMVASAVATEFWMFAGARLLLGLGSGMTGPAIRRLVVVRAPDDVGSNLGKQMGYDMGGFVLGPLLAAAAAEVAGIRAPFVLMAVLFGVMFLLVLRLDLHAGEASHEQRVVRGLLRNRPLLATLCAAIAFYITIGTFETVWAVLLRDRGAETWLIGVTLSLFTVPMIFLAPYGGKTAHQRGPIRVVSLSIGTAIVCTFAYGVIPSLWVILLISLVHAVADSFTMPGNQVAVAMAAPPTQVAAALGLLGATGLATAGLVGLVAGAIYEHAGRGVLFTGTAVVMGGFLLAAMRLGRELDQPVVAAPAVTG
jgi:MFS family permease